MSILSDIGQGVREAAERSAAAVVGVRSRRGVGSGVVVHHGVVLTNAHNVTHSAVEVVLPDGTVVPSTDVTLDADGDLAVVRVGIDVAAIAWHAGSGGVELGAGVVALANPAGHGVRATFGTVSAVEQTFRGPRGRRISGGFEHTAPLPRGSSGGPVVDGDGALLGINTARLSDGFYLALPTDEHLRARVDALSAGETRARVQLGVAIAPSQVARRLRAAVGLPERDGLLVHHVAEDTPAAAAGLARGDLLVAAGDSALRSVDDLHRVLDEVSPGDELSMSVVRGIEELTVTVTFPR